MIPARLKTARHHPRSGEAARRSDLGRFHEVDEAFHAAISDAAGYPGIWRLAQTVKAQVDRCRRLTLPVPGRTARVIQEHQRVLAALEAGDAAGARQALTEHLVAVLPDLEELRRMYRITSSELPRLALRCPEGRCRCLSPR